MIILMLQESFRRNTRLCKLNLKKIIFENEGNALNITNFTQISIFTASMSIFQNN